MILSHIDVQGVPYVMGEIKKHINTINFYCIIYPPTFWRNKLLEYEKVYTHYPYGITLYYFRWKKNLLELFVFVLHENRAIDDIDNANRISATRCNLRCGFVAIIWVGFKYYIPDLEKIFFVQSKYHQIFYDTEISIFFSNYRVLRME